MKVLIIGGGGREHALAWAVSRSASNPKIFCAPGNAGIAEIATCAPIDSGDIAGLRDFAQKNSIDLTIVGPELPLTLGIVDAFTERNLPVFGPSQSAARLEGSKLFAKNIMQAAGIPTASFRAFSDHAEAAAWIQKQNKPLVVKADGLAAGKGVFPCRTPAEALTAVTRIMVDNEFGNAGSTVVIEDFLCGEEASFICLTDGTTILPLPSSQDHKPVFNEDRGPNTGGMGAYSPAPVITPDLHERVMRTVMQPLITTLASRGIVYKGVIYAGLMIDNGVPNVLEFNVRMGDPETQPIMLRLQTDIIELMLSVIDGRLDRMTVECDPRPAVCVVMAAGGYPGAYARGLPVSGLQAAGRNPDTVVFHAGTAFCGDAICTAGGRVLGVTSLGDTTRAAITAVYRAVTQISWPDAHYRTDIGRKALDRYNE